MLIFLLARAGAGLRPGVPEHPHPFMVDLIIERRVTRIQYQAHLLALQHDRQCVQSMC